ncbi:hypothetical protein TNCV_2761691 [Trichonephila clavipes]|nr:hypothetical protein TNCV_2761691 [Trichonephila clavipes]
MSPVVATCNRQYPTLRENILKLVPPLFTIHQLQERTYDYLEYPHAVNAFYIYKQPCLLWNSDTDSNYDLFFPATTFKGCCDLARNDPGGNHEDSRVLSVGSWVHILFAIKTCHVDGIKIFTWTWYENLKKNIIASSSTVLKPGRDSNLKKL